MCYGRILSALSAELRPRSRIETTLWLITFTFRVALQILASIAMKSRTLMKRLKSERLQLISEAWHSDGIPLLCILVLAFGIRIFAIFVFPSLHHPDENYQVFEQAHRIAFGYGIKPWEFTVGIRSLLLPALFARVFRASAAASPRPQFYIAIARLLLAALSVPVVAALYIMGRRASQTHAILVGLVAASWFELVYFSYRPLTEAIATNFLLFGLALASVPESELTESRLFSIGFCFCMTLMLRIHLLPAIIVVSILICGFEMPERWLSLLLGAIPPLIAFGASDWVAWGYPFRSYVEAVRINLVESKATAFGVEPWDWYFQRIFQNWASALPILVALALLRLRASRLWIAASIAILVSHSMIPHKEYRFIFPACACIIVVAAMGSADLIEKTCTALGHSFKPYLTIAVAIVWVAISAHLAFGPGFRDNWYKRRGLIQAFYAISETPNVCGILLYEHSWGATGGYTYLHRNVPLYSTVLSIDSVKRVKSAFNFVILRSESVSSLQPDFTLQSCNDAGVCVMTRPGPCSANDELVPLLSERGLGDPDTKTSSR